MTLAPEHDRDEQVGENARRFPAVYYVADQLALTSQRRHLYLVRMEVSGLVLAAIASCLGTLFPGFGYLFSGASAMFLAVALVVQLLGYRRGWNADWFADRGVAETTLSASWRYMVRAEPFESAQPAGERFAQMLADMHRGSGRLAQRVAPLGARGFEATAWMERIRQDSWPGRAAIYASERLAEQRGWYERKSRYNAACGRWFGTAAVVSNALAAVFLVVHLANASWDFVGVFTTLATSLIAWSSAKRFQELQTSYGFVSQELGLVQAQLVRAVSEVEFLRYALQSEETITQEHALWVIRRVEHHPKHVRLRAFAGPATGSDNQTP